MAAGPANRWLGGVPDPTTPGWCGFFLFGVTGSSATAISYSDFGLQVPRQATVNSITFRHKNAQYNISGLGVIDLGVMLRANASATPVDLGYPLHPPNFAQPLDCGNDVWQQVSYSGASLGSFTPDVLNAPAFRVYVIDATLAGTVTMSGAEVVVDYTPAPANAQLVVRTTTDRPDDITTTFGYTGAVSGSTIRNGSLGSGLLVPGTYDVNQATPPPGYQLDSISCDDGGSTYASTTDTNAGLARFELEANETTTCTFAYSALTDIAAQVSAPAVVHPGETADFAIQVANLGDISALATTVDIAFPAALDFNATTGCVEDPSGQPTCTLGTLAAGATQPVTVSAHIPVDFLGSASLQVNAQTSTTDTATANNSASAGITVTSPANVVGTSSVSGEFRPGGTVTFTVALTNTSAYRQFDDPGSAEFEASLPASLLGLSASADRGAATFNGNTLQWNGDIPGGATVTLQVTAQLPYDIDNGQRFQSDIHVFFDADGDGINDTRRLVAGLNSARSVAFTAAFPVDTLGAWGIVPVALLLAALATVRLGRTARA